MGIGGGAGNVIFMCLEDFRRDVIAGSAGSECNIVLVVSDSKARSWGLQGSSGQGWLRSRCEFVVIFKTALCH